VYHTYSTFARGPDGLWGMYQWLDRAPNGRNETGVWCHRHDEYEKSHESGECCGNVEARGDCACCIAARAPGRLSRVAVSILPAALLVVLPKCPLVAAVALAFSPMVRRRVFWRAAKTSIDSGEEARRPLLCTRGIRRQIAWRAAALRHGCGRGVAA
jgi:hypothetical protein